MPSNTRRAVLFILAVLSLSLVGCDQNNEAKNEKSDRPRSFDLQTSNSQTYIIERTSGTTYVLKSGEFVRVPIIDVDMEKTDFQIKTYNEDLKDLSLEIRLKYLNGQLHYQISASPAMTEEYLKYVSDSISRISKKSNDTKSSSANETDQLAPLVKPAQMYKNPNWQKYWDVTGNSLGIGLYDSDYFGVTKIYLILSGPYMSPRTKRMNNNDQVISMDYEGEVDLTAVNFRRIESTNTTYVLNNK